MKKCTKCMVAKPLESFYKNAKSRDGRTWYCKDCTKAEHAKWRTENADHMAAYRKTYVAKNPDRAREAKLRYAEANKESIKAKKAAKYLAERDRRLAQAKENSLKRADEIKAYAAAYRERNREQLRANQREYMKANREARSAYNKAYAAKRRASDPIFSLKCRLRSRIGCFLAKRGYGKPAKTYELVGCSYEQLALHLESLFLPGMTWENRKAWHVDHRIPLSSAVSPEEAFALCHYTNLQPLWAGDNISKGGKLPEELS